MDENNVFIYDINKSDCIEEREFYIYQRSSAILIKPVNKINNDKISFLFFKKENLFFSIRKFIKRKGYGHVIIYCYDKNNENFTRHEYYQSNSQLSFYRYCDKRMDDGAYDKGYNYITSTLINMKLQKFIIINKKNFIEIEINEPIDCLASEEIKNRITNQSFISQNEFFILLNKLFPNADFNYRQAIKAITEELKNPKNDLSKEILLIIARTILALNENNKKKHETETEADKYWILMYIFNNLFLKYFNLDEKTLEIEFENRVFIENINIDLIVKSITINYKLVARKYKLYYIVYNWKKLGIIKKYKNILCIEPLEDNFITCSGLNNRYVATGIFINKVFEYREQSIRLMRDTISTGGNYIFIGDLNSYDFLP
jgi:hypothetical protein